MANPKIKVKRSSVEGKVPAVSQLERGELAVNSYDGKIYILKDQFSVGIATTTHTINPWNEPNGVGAGISYGGDIKILGISTFSSNVKFDGSIGVGIANPSQKIHIDGGNLLISNSTQSGSSAPQTGDNHFINGAASNDSCIAAPSNILFGVGSTRKFRIKNTDVLTDVDLIPSGDNQTSLGRSNARWSDLYTVDATFSGDVTFTGDNHNIKFDKSDDRLEFADGAELSLGDSEDFKIHYENLRTFARQHGAGPFVFDLMDEFNLFHITGGQLTSDIAKFIPNGPIELYHNNTLRLKTSSSGVNITDDLGVSGVSTFSDNIFVDDNVEIRLGEKTASNTRVGDFTIEHNNNFFGNGEVFNALTSTNGNIQIENRDTSGSNRFLFLKANAVQLRTYTGNESLLTATINQGVSLFYDNSQKFVTTNTGGTLTGTLVTDGLTLGNFNMPTTIGAQDTVLKSDGTNVVFGSAASATFTEKAFTATQGQTVFTDTTDLPTYVQVFVNGVKIRPTSDFSKSGASVTLVNAATAGDEIDIVRFD